MAIVVSIDGSPLEGLSPPPPEAVELLAAARAAFTAIAELGQAEVRAAAAFRRVAGCELYSRDYSSWGFWADLVKAAVDEAAFQAYDLEEGCCTCQRDNRLDAGAAILELAEVPLHGLDENGMPRAGGVDTLTHRALDLVAYTREQLADERERADGA